MSSGPVPSNFQYDRLPSSQRAALDSLGDSDVDGENLSSKGLPSEPATPKASPGLQRSGSIVYESGGKAAPTEPPNTIKTPESISVPKAQEPAPLMPPPPPPTALTHAAVDKRIRRALEPNSKGQYKVSEDIRKLWEDGNREKVFKLFADCGNDTDVFVKRFSVKKDHEKEMELGVFFKFMAEDQMDEENISEKLFWIQHVMIF